MVACVADACHGCCTARALDIVHSHCKCARASQQCLAKRASRLTVPRPKLYTFGGRKMLRGLQHPSHACCAHCTGFILVAHTCATTLSCFSPAQTSARPASGHGHTLHVWWMRKTATCGNACARARASMRHAQDYSIKVFKMLGRVRSLCALSPRL